MAATASARPAGFHPLEAMVNDMSRDFTLFSSRLREETATLGTRLRSAPLPATTADVEFVRSRVRKAEKSLNELAEEASSSKSPAIRDVLALSRALLNANEETLDAAAARLPAQHVEKAAAAAAAAVGSAVKSSTSENVASVDSPAAGGPAAVTVDSVRVAMTPVAASAAKAPRVAAAFDDESDDDAPTLESLGISESTLGMLAATPAKVAAASAQKAAAGSGGASAGDGDDDEAFQSPPPPDTLHAALTPAALLASLREAQTPPKAAEEVKRGPKIVAPISAEEVTTAPSYLRMECSNEDLNAEVGRLNELFAEKRAAQETGSATRSSSPTKEVSVTQDEVSTVLAEKARTRQLLLLLLHLRRLHTAGKGKYAIED